MLAESCRWPLVPKVAYQGPSLCRPELRRVQLAPGLAGWRGPAFRHASLAGSRRACQSMAGALLSLVCARRGATRGRCRETPGSSTAALAEHLSRHPLGS
uniref:Uncharacterized protein n=1 Tax=Arundo donax TaxID=35708 RepID=A0A0A8ZB55_ARUDO